MNIALILLTFTAIGPQALEETADLLYKNECSKKASNLVHWKDGEEFLSLGIGHFIWYAEEQKGPFDEGFPKFIQYCKAHNVPLIPFFEQNRFCPWKSRQEFANAPKSQIEEITNFLLKTRLVQAECIAERLYAALPKMTNVLPTDEKAKIEARFSKVAKAKGGLFALIDYVNFKGEGVAPLERYNGQGWGLLQVLQGMHDSEDVLADFCQSAKQVLRARVANSPKERNEARWIQGWCNRVENYK